MPWLTRRLAWSLPLAHIVTTSACSTGFSDSPLTGSIQSDSSGSDTNDGGQTSGTDGDGGPASTSSSTTGDDGSTGGLGDHTEPLPLRPGPPHAPGELHAASWRDLDHWPAWTTLLDSDSPWAAAAALWELDTVGRRWPVIVTFEGMPAADVAVSVLDRSGDNVWSARSDARGRLELFGDFADGATHYTLVVDGMPTEATRTSDTDATTVLVTTPPPAASKLDVMFVVDTTGSMADELDYLQTRLEDVLLPVASDAVEMRASVNFYRDEGEEYVLRSHSFTADLDVFLEQLVDADARGGGDLPEAVDLALEDAVFSHDWSTTARARLLFLVLDAPPRAEPEVIERLHATVVEAAALGIQIMPITGTATDEETALWVRHLAIQTGGTYAFITEPAPQTASSSAPTVGEYRPLPFDLLLDSLIEDMVR